MKLRPYFGFRFTSRGIRPYSGVALSLSSRRKQPHKASHVEKIVYHCSHCNAINPQTAKFCNKCGARFS